MKLTLFFAILSIAATFLLQAQTVTEYRLRLYEPFIKEGGIWFPKIYVGANNDAPMPPEYKTKDGKVIITTVAEINAFLKAKFPEESSDIFFSKWLPNLLVLCLSQHESKVIRSSDSAFYARRMLISELLHKYGSVNMTSTDKGCDVNFFVWVNNGAVDQWSIVCEKDPPRIVSVSVVSKESPFSYTDALLTKWERNQKKLSDLILPDVNFEGDIKNVLALLEIKSREIDPERVGLHTFMDLDANTKLDPINIKGHNMSLLAVCTIVANQTFTQFEAEDDGIHFEPWPKAVENH